MSQVMGTHDEMVVLRAVHLVFCNLSGYEDSASHQG